MIIIIRMNCVICDENDSTNKIFCNICNCHMCKICVLKYIFTYNNDICPVCRSNINISEITISHNLFYPEINEPENDEENQGQEELPREEKNCRISLIKKIIIFIIFVPIWYSIFFEFYKSFSYHFLVVSIILSFLFGFIITIIILLIMYRFSTAVHSFST